MKIELLLPLVALLGAASLPSCSTRQSQATAAGQIELTGKVLHIQDDSEVDGPIVLMIESEPGKTTDLYFGSVFTRPSPDARRRAIFERVRRVRVGDRVLAQGSPMDGGQIWIEQLENLDRD